MRSSTSANGAAHEADNLWTIARTLRAPRDYADGSERCSNRHARPASVTRPSRQLPGSSCGVCKGGMAASIQSFGMSEQLSIRRPYAICRRLAWFPGTFSRHAFPKPSDLPPQASSDLSSSALRAEAAHVRWRSRFSRADNGPPAGTRCGGPSKRPQEQRSMGGMHVNAHPRGNDRTTNTSPPRHGVTRAKVTFWPVRGTD